MLLFAAGQVRFYKLMIEYDTHEKATFNLCQVSRESTRQAESCVTVSHQPHRRPIFPNRTNATPPCHTTYDTTLHGVGISTFIAYDKPFRATKSQDYHSIYDTPSVRDGEGEGWKEYLRAAVLFLVLSPNGNHQQDMLFRVAAYKKLEDLPAYKVCWLAPFFPSSLLFSVSLVSPAFLIMRRAFLRSRPELLLGAVKLRPRGGPCAPRWS